MPDTVGGVTLTKLSFAGDELSAFPGSQGFLDLMTELGATPDNAALATGTAPENAVAILAFRVTGVEGSRLLQAFAAQGQSQGGTVGQATVGGKQVTTFTAAGTTTPQYFYSSGDVLFIVVGSDQALQEQAVTALP